MGVERRLSTCTVAHVGISEERMQAIEAEGLISFGLREIKRGDRVNFQIPARVTSST